MLKLWLELEAHKLVNHPLVVSGQCVRVDKPKGSPGQPHRPFMIAERVKIIDECKAFGWANITQFNVAGYSDAV